MDKNYLKSYESASFFLSTSPKNKSAQQVLAKSFSILFNEHAPKGQYANKYATPVLLRNYFKNTEKLLFTLKKGYHYLPQNYKFTLDSLVASQKQLRSHLVHTMTAQIDSLLQVARTQSNTNAAQKVIRITNDLKTDFNLTLDRNRHEAEMLMHYKLAFDLSSAMSHPLGSGLLEKANAVTEYPLGFEVDFEDRIDYPDFRIKIVLEPIDVETSSSSDISFHCRQVEDGCIITKDSLGNETRTPIYKTVSATVNTDKETKKYSVKAEVIIEKMNSKCEAENNVLVLEHNSIEIDNLVVGDYEAVSLLDSRSHDSISFIHNSLSRQILHKIIEYYVKY
jgi:hypothetical protein